MSRKFQRKGVAVAVLLLALVAAPSADVPNDEYAVHIEPRLTEVRRHAAGMPLRSSAPPLRSTERT